MGLEVLVLTVAGKGFSWQNFHFSQSFALWKSGSITSKGILTPLAH